MRMPWSRRPVLSAAPASRSRPLFSTDIGLSADAGRKAWEHQTDQLRRSAPVVTAPAGTAMDSASGVGLKEAMALAVPNLPDLLLAWYASQGFMGYQMAAIVAQHWLVDKVCTMPARDAVRHGFDVTLDGTASEDGDEIKAVTKADKRYRLRAHMRDFIRKGRIFGVRIAIFKVKSDDPKYYEKPFNPDGVTPGSYEGIVMVDPYWTMPQLDMASVSSPGSAHFYDPTWWQIDGVLYHRSHLCIFRNSDLPDLLKPSYNYGGIPVPQQIMERVYAAERTANEAPQLAMAKRTIVWNTDIEALLGNQDAFAQHMANFTELMNNFGVKINDRDDTMTQLDTSLADLDETIMTQFQLVCAAGRVPATKLLGTTPKGFNSTGEYEEASYHEELETIQENDLQPLVDRHHLLVLRSDIEPQFSYKPGTLSANIDWRPLDSPTGKERAEINKLNADTDAILVNTGAIDGIDVRDRLRKDGDSGYAGLAQIEEPAAPDPNDPLNLNPILGPPALGAA